MRTTSENDTDQKQISKKWLEFHIGESTVVYDDVFTLQGAGTNIFVGDHFWNVESKAIAWVPNKKRVCIWKNVHCAATLKMSQFVLNVDKWIILKPFDIFGHMQPFFDVQG